MTANTLRCNDRKCRCGCSYCRTPVDEALGRPFQDAIVTAVNSFYKQPLVEVEPRDVGGDDSEQESEEVEGDVAMEEQESASSRP